MQPPMIATDAHLQDRLEAAMAKAGLTSRRGLAVMLAGGPKDKQKIESYRRLVRRILDGKQDTVIPRTAGRLSAVLCVPVDYWPTERQPAEAPPSVTDLAVELVRRLDAGEYVPDEQLASAARQLDETAALCGRLADRLRARRVGAR